MFLLNLRANFQGFVFRCLCRAWNRVRFCCRFRCRYRLFRFFVWCWFCRLLWRKVLLDWNIRCGSCHVLRLQIGCYLALKSIVLLRLRILHVHRLQLGFGNMFLYCWLVLCRGKGEVVRQNGHWWSLFRLGVVVCLCWLRSCLRRVFLLCLVRKGLFCLVV